MFLLAFLLNPPVPLYKGGTYEGVKVYQHTYDRNEHSRRARRSPLFKRGARGDLILSDNPLYRTIFMTSAINAGVKPDSYGMPGHVFLVQEPSPF